MTSPLLGKRRGVRDVMAPIVVVSTADLPTVNTGVAWADLDPTGSANARNLDLVIPGVEAGDWISVEATGLWNNEATVAYLDLFTIVDGVPVNSFGEAGGSGIATWAAVAGQYAKISGKRSYKLTPADIKDGSVRLRPRYFKNSATAKVMYGASAGYRFRLEGTGPFV